MIPVLIFVGASFLSLLIIAIKHGTPTEEVKPLAIFLSLTFIIGVTYWSGMYTPFGVWDFAYLSAVALSLLSLEYKPKKYNILHSLASEGVSFLLLWQAGFFEGVL